MTFMPGLSGILGGALVGAPPVLTYRGQASTSADQTTYNFNSKAVGTAVFDRVLVVALGGHKQTSSARSITSVTFELAAATEIKQLNNIVNGESTVNAFYILALPAGTTVDVSVTYNAAMSRAGMGWWTITGLNSLTPVALDFNTDETDIVLTLPADSIALLCNNSQGTSGPRSTVWDAALDEKWDDILEGWNRQSGAEQQFASGGTKSLSQTLSGNVDTYTVIGVGLR